MEKFDPIISKIFCYLKRFGHYCFEVLIGIPVVHHYHHKFSQKTFTAGHGLCPKYHHSDRFYASHIQRVFEVKTSLAALCTYFV